MRLLEDQVRERLERHVLTRINCDPPVGTVHDTIVVRADIIVPPNIEVQLKPVVRCVEVEGFRKRMLKRTGVRLAEGVSFEARFDGRELGVAPFACRFMLLRRRQIQSASVPSSYSQGRK